jgi:hypothetical protein
MLKQTISQKENKLIELVSGFCDEKLYEEYKKLSIKMVKKLGRKRDIPFKRGKLEIWASGVIYALAQINFLFDKSFEPYSSPSEICKYFSTKKSTTANKALDIRKLLNLRVGDDEFSTHDMKCFVGNQNDLTYVRSRDGAKSDAMLKMIGDIFNQLYQNRK